MTPEFDYSNVPFNNKRRKVFAITTHINGPIQDKNRSVCDQEDNPFEHDDLESQENLVSTQMHVFPNDLESEKVGPESVYNREENFHNVELPEDLDDGRINGQSEEHQNFDLKTTFPQRRVSVIRDFPKAFDQLSGKINLIENEAMTCAETVKNLDNNKITDKSEGGFESVENDFISLENFIHKEMHDLSNDLGFERPKALDNEDSCDQLDISGEKCGICLPGRRVSVIRFFPPGCGRNAARISEEDRMKIIAKEPFFEVESDTKQVEVEAQGEDIEGCLDNTNDMNQNIVGVCLDTSNFEEQDVDGSEQPRVIVQALMAAPRCPWRWSKRASTSKLKQGI